MKFKLLLSILLFLISLASYGQTDFRPGYVINADGDTLNGAIDYRGDIKMGKICRFRNELGEVTEYYPADILAYRFKDSKYFITKDIEGNKVFLEFLIKGKVSIYYLRDTHADRYFIEKEGIGLTEMPNSDKTIVINGRKYHPDNKQRTGLLIFYMQEAPNLKKNITSLGSPDHLELVKLAEKYHNQVCSDQSCIIYDKKVPGVSVNVEAFVGSANFNLAPEFKDLNFFQTGVLAHIWMPRANEKLFLRTGIAYTHLKYYSKDASIYRSRNLYKMPLQVEYVYPKNSFKPKAAIGITYYKSIFFFPSAMIGLNIKINKYMDLGLNCDLEFLPHDKLIIVPSHLFSNTVSGGIIFKL